MRLSSEEQRQIADAARAVLPSGSRVLLFGSRTDDQRRGGDVDLLVGTTAALPADDTFSLLSRLLAQLYMRLGERRIDVLASVRGGPDARAVVQAARERGTELVRA
jgi:predicted nucleotidyltransferase